MRTNQFLAQKNAAYLEQALELLDSLPARLFEARPLHFERGGVGVHLRHVLDHYDAFLDGVESGRIDYDARERDAATECDIQVARARLAATLRRLTQVFARPELAGAGPGREIEVALDAELRGAPLPSHSVSSLGRELQYLVAHTVHHFALMAVALRVAGHEPRADFGVASSTLRHEASSNGACAR